MSRWNDLRETVETDYHDEFGSAMLVLMDAIESLMPIPDILAREIERVCCAFDDEVAYAITQVRNEYESSDTYHHDVGFDEGYQAAMEERDGA